MKTYPKTQNRVINTIMYAYQLALRDLFGKASSAIDTYARTTLIKKIGQTLVKNVLSAKSIKGGRIPWQGTIKGIPQDVIQILITELQLCDKIKSIKSLGKNGENQREFIITNCFLKDTARKLAKKNQSCILCPIALILAAIVKTAFKKNVLIIPRVINPGQTCKMKIQINKR